MYLSNLRKITFILLLVFILPMNMLFAQTKVTLTTHNLYPYGSFPEDGAVKKIADDTFTGAAIDVVREACEMIGIDLEVHVVPWARAQSMVKTGSADGFFAGSQKDSRDAFAVMSAYIADQNWNWYLLNSNPMNPNDPSFKTEAEVAGFIGSNMLKWMEEEKYNVTAKPLNTESLLMMLLSERVDAVMANNLVMKALIEKNNAQTKVKTYLNKEKPLGVYFSKTFVNKYPDFLPKFNAAVEEIRNR